MERKLLWVISGIVIFILWIKIEPQDTRQAVQDNAPVPEIDVKTPPKSIGDTQDNNVTPEDADYFKSHPIDTKKPDFESMVDVQERKSAFFAYLLPFVQEKNELLLKDRERLQKILNSAEPPSREDKVWIGALREIHKLRKLGVYTHADIAALLRYVDVIPASLVLAQAANESAWGTSRFAIEGNNYFGQWCFTKGCGIVPAARSEDQDHEVQKFSDARESVFAYIDNLNSNSAYKELRNIRKQLRDSNDIITGLALVHGLENYSQRGQDYVEEIESLIDYNELWRFNVHSLETAYVNE